MFSKIRSLIFKLDPETAHDLAIKALKFNPIPQDKIKNNNLIQTEIFGKVIPNPINPHITLVNSSNMKLNPNSTQPLDLIKLRRYIILCLN